MVGGYHLGVDLGMSYTAAAVCRAGQSEVVHLGAQGSAIPSAIFLGPDGRLVVGDAAVRRALLEPDRIAREFKRRFGDPVPLMLGGSPMGADVLTARLLEWVLDTVAERQAGPPDRVAVTYPANWGPYKRDLLAAAVRLAGIAEPVLVSEPEAAVLSYVDAPEIGPGSLIAVYDLGGCTFDAAVLRRTESGFELVGRAEGIDRLGGVDFDQAVLGHVRAAVGEPLTGLDAADPDNAVTVARLLTECVTAKEALSEDTDTLISVTVRHASTHVRLTRSEFEELIRPSLEPTLDVLTRVIESAGTAPSELAALMLVGGSSRIPLVPVLIGQRLGVPVSVDAHPKDRVALGAARAAELAASPAVALELATATGTPDVVEADAVKPAVPIAPGGWPATAASHPAPEVAGPRPLLTIAPVRGLRGSRRQVAIIGGALVAVLLLALGVLFGPALLSAKPAGPTGGELFLEPAQTPGADPFTEDTLTGPVPPVLGQTPQGGGPGETPSVPGDQPALYGGSRNNGVCDKDKLVGFLLANPDKAAAWAGVLGIGAAQIPQYVSVLTPVVLRADSRVLNHGYREGRATARESVLQAGTAVLVDERGVPRVKCGCGNPLGEPTPVPGPVRYDGPPWSGFDPAHLLRVAPAVGSVDRFILIDLINGLPFVRPRGTNGQADADATGLLPSSALLPTALPTPSPTPAGAAAPGNLTGVRHNYSGSQFITVTWTAPDLGGGTLAGYEVSGTGAVSGAFTKTVTAPAYQDNDNYCSPGVTYQVRALTVPAGSAATVRGAPATLTVSTPVDCTPSLTVDGAASGGPNTVQVSFHCVGGVRGNQRTSDVALYFNGVRMWAGTCTLDYRGNVQQTAVVNGLSAGATYNVRGVVTGISGSKNSNTVTVTTSR